MKIVTCILVVLGISASSFGDVVYLTGGGRFEGRVKDRGEQVELEMTKGRIVIKKSQIVSIEKKRHVLDDYDEQAAKVSHDDEQGQVKLARWCKVNGLDAQAKKHFQLVLALDAKNEEAANALGLEVKQEKPAAEPKTEPAKTTEPPEAKKPPGEKRAGLFDLEESGSTATPKKDTGTALDESLNGLRLYASEKDVIAAVGEPEERKEFPNGQSGMYYRSRGLHVFLNDRGVYAFNILSPDWRLKSGIKPGGALEEVFKLYGPYEDKVTGSLGQFYDKPVLITDPKNGNQAIRYHTGYSFWAKPSGEIMMIRVTLEGMKSPQGDQAQPPREPEKKGDEGAPEKKEGGSEAEKKADEGGKGPPKRGPPGKALPSRHKLQLWTWERATRKEPSPAALPRQQALEDLARFREVVEQGYCGYDYFARQGHDWEKTFSELRKAVESRATWTPGEMAKLFTDALRFTGDRHFIFHGRRDFPRSFQAGRHQDAYFADVVVVRVNGGLKALPRESAGSRDLIGAGDWFLTSCNGEDPKTHLFRTLDPQHGGEAFLLGVLSEDPAEEIKVRLRSAGGQEREVKLPLHRGRMSEYTPDRSSVFTYTAKPFPILQVTTFDIKGASAPARQKLEEFEATGSRPEVRNSRAVLVDVRGNGGGQDIPGPAWLNALTNEPIKSCVVERLRSPLHYEAMLNMELWRHVNPGGGTKASFEALRAAFLRGEEIPSSARGYAVDRRQSDTVESRVNRSTKAPSRFSGTLLILYDGRSGSAAEDFIQMTRQLEHAVTLGENSAGMCSFGECLVYDLPNSKLSFQCGNKLICDERGEMHEGKGFSPDYWFDDPDPLSVIVKNVGLLKPHSGH